MEILSHDVIVDNPATQDDPATRDDSAFLDDQVAHSEPSCNDDPMDHQQASPNSIIEEEKKNDPAMEE